MWADVDTKLDFLNYSEVAEIVVGVVQDPTMRPVSVGIFGTWGSGKSTLLNLIEAELNPASGSPDCLIVRFDAWLYQGFDDSRAALMEVIASALVAAAADQPTLLTKAKKVLGRVNKMRALGLLVEGGALAMGVPTFGFANKGIQALGDMFTGQGDEQDVKDVEDSAKQAKERLSKLLDPDKQNTPPKEIAAFRSEFEEVLTALNKTLVVFVDNLDRCLPKQTIQTLESLRLFLFMGNTAFIVAADEEMVRHSVSEFFKDPDDRHVTDYLDKLIQVPIRVPRLGVQEVRAYLFLLFASAGNLVTSVQIEKLRIGLESNLRKAWKEEPISTEQALALLGPNTPSEIPLSFNTADRMASILAKSTLVQGNPRIVKRMLNIVRMRTRTAKLREMPIDEAMIAKLALFERCTDIKAVEHIYTEINSSAGGKPNILVKLESLLEDPEQFEKHCPEPWKAKSEFVREWLSLDPPLASIDLRPLVYLSRETIPLRILKGGLSEPAGEALRVLLRTSSISSPSGMQAAVSIPEGEQEAVMSGLIQSFRDHTNWSTKPAGFEGALLLADRFSNAAPLLASFINTVMTGKLRPWLKVLLNDRAWFDIKETH